MSVTLYMDVHIPYAITTGLRLRGVDVLTSQEDGSRRFLDPDLLDRSTEPGRILFTQDEDLLEEAATRQRSGESFAGLIYAHQTNVTIGQSVDDLELIAKTFDAEEWMNRVEFLPLK